MNYLDYEGLGDVVSIIKNSNNDNLLLNPDFKLSKYKTLDLMGNGMHQYICDKWYYFWDAEGSANYNNGIISLKYGRIFQDVDLPAGKYTVTANILESDTTIVVHINGYGYRDYYVGNFGNTPGIHSFTFEVHEFSNILFQLIAESPTIVKIGWIKLEAGDTSTKYIPPNNELESLKCYGYSVFSRPNLFYNSNFKINQRGETTYGASKYTVDRWKSGPDAEITVLNNGIKTTCTDNTTYNQGVRQYIECDIDNLIGKPFTLSLEVDTTNIPDEITTYPNRYRHWFNINGKVFSYYPTEKKSKEIIVFTNTIQYAEQEGYKDKLVCYLNTITGTIIKWAKLEIGETATPYIPPDPGLELIKCRRYYQTIIGEYTPHVYGDDVIYISLKLNGSLYRRPTVSFKNDHFNEVYRQDPEVKGVGLVSYLGGVYTGFTFSTFVNGSEGDIGDNIRYINVVAKKTAHGLMNNAYFVIGADNPLCVDAEIY